MWEKGNRYMRKEKKKKEEVNRGSQIKYYFNMYSSHLQCLFKKQMSMSSLQR